MRLRRSAAEFAGDRGAHGAGDLVEDVEAAAHVLERNDAHLLAGRPLDGAERIDEVVQLAGVDEPPRGEHRADAARAQGGREVLLAGGEIQHGGNAAVGVEAKQRDDETDRVRQQHRDGVARPRLARDLAAEHVAREHELLVGERGSFGVLDDDLVRPVRLGGVQQARKERRPGATGIEVQEHGEVPKPAAGMARTERK